MASPADSAPGAAEAPGPRAPLAARAIATVLGVGLAPWAPGTVGSAAALLLLLVPGASAPPVLAALIAAFFFAGRWAALRVAIERGHELRGGAAAAKRAFQGNAPPAHPDPSVVVIDEVVGMWTALLFLPPGIPGIVIAFTTFRAFDIVKPPPCAALERVPGGWGIMLDDLAAGVYANLATRAVLALIG